MKSTGIVRRVDDLGRVMIPKEIRRTLKIKEGNLLEIFVEGECVIYKKYTDTAVEDYLAILKETVMDDFEIQNREKILSLIEQLEDIVEEGDNP
jgi:transcriptional pleiotropic regulator of transition state genes